MDFSNDTKLQFILGGALVFLIALAVLPTVFQQFNQAKVLVSNDGFCSVLGERLTHVSETEDDFTGANAVEVTQDGTGCQITVGGNYANGDDVYTPNGTFVAVAAGVNDIPAAVGAWVERPQVVEDQQRLNETIVNLLPLVLIVAGLLAAGSWIYNARGRSMS